MQGVPDMTTADTDADIKFYRERLDEYGRKADSYARLYEQTLGMIHSLERPEVAIIPASTYTRLLAIEAAARNAMENSEVPDKWEYSEDSAHYAGGTWLDPKDAKELKDALADFERLAGVVGE